MAVKKGSKNNIANRGEAAKIKRYDGKEVEPVQLIISGKKKFIAAQFKENGKLVKGSSGEFVAYDAIQ